MKTVVYITKKRIWVNEKVFVWDGESMDEVFERVRRDLKVEEVRVVLGDDVSFAGAVKAVDTVLTKESVLKLIKPEVPFEVEMDCFDWKQVVLTSDEVWVQVVAIQKKLLKSLSLAAKRQGVRVFLVTAIGVLLGETTKGREAPVIVKWSGKENLSVLAVDGMADFVAADMNEEALMAYAVKRWGLAVNPEEITLKESDFDLEERVFAERSKGEDRFVLNLPVLNEAVLGGVAIERVGEKMGIRLPWWAYLLVLLALAAVVVAIVRW
jgi:hypothetical protein